MCLRNAAGVERAPRWPGRGLLPRRLPLLRRRHVERHRPRLPLVDLHQVLHGMLRRRVVLAILAEGVRCLFVITNVLFVTI